MTEESIDLEVLPLPPDGLQISPISIAVDPLDLSQVPTNPVTMHFFFRQDSIARLTEVAPGHYRTSVNRWMMLEAEVEPAGFAPLVEWSLDGVPQRIIGSPVAMVVYPARSFDIEAGVGDLAQHVRLDTYRVKITSHERRRADIPDDEAVTFTAVTDPPGHEDEITWLASTKHGTAIPLTGTGPELTTVFVNTRGEEQRWLGVRADNATVSVDAKLSDSQIGEEGTEELPQLSARADAVCDTESSHRIEIVWDILNAQAPKDVEIDISLSDGSTFLVQGEATGAASFTVDSPFGGRVSAVMRGADAGTDGPFVRLIQTLAPLASCVDFAAPPFGFEPGEPVIAAPGTGSIREVDVLAVGSPTTNLREKIITVIGSGSSFQLSAWLSDGGATPSLLHQEDIVEGFDIKLHELNTGEMEVPVQAGTQPFIVASRRDDGNLWLSVYTVEADGDMVRHSTLGYGANAGVTVAGYGIAHRARIESPEDVSFQVVTPVITLGGALRLVIWDVEDDTLTLRGVRDSGGVIGFTNPSDLVDALHVEGPLYVVAYRSETGFLSSTYWDIEFDGDLLQVGGATSGRSLRGTASIFEPITEVALAPVLGGGYATATPSGPADVVDMVVWEAPQIEPWIRLFDTYRIADNRLDQKPGFGVSIPEPTRPNDALDPDDDFMRPVYAMLTDALWEEFGRGEGVVFSQLPTDEPQAIASLTKVMTLVLALEAIGRGDPGASFDAQVTVKSNAANEAPSIIGLAKNQSCALEDLLYALILPSAGDAAVAIAEHLAGDEQSFVDRMNKRAEQLQMSETKYGRPRGSAISTPQDQITLLLHGLRIPRFTDFMTRKRKDIVCENPGGLTVKFQLRKSDSNYPGLVAYKGGSRGGQLADELRCPKNGCLVVAAQRLSRTFAAVLLASGNINRDSNTLFDFGFQQLFTPDFRTDDRGAAGEAAEFALDAIFDATAVTAALDGTGNLELCTWSVDVGDGRLQKIGCGSQPPPALAPGENLRLPTVELVRLSRQDSAGDYIRGYLQNGNLNLDLWRIAPKQPPDGGFIPPG